MHSRVKCLDASISILQRQIPSVLETTMIHSDVLVLLVTWVKSVKTEHSRFRIGICVSRTSLGQCVAEKL